MSVIVGAKTIEQLDDNLAAAELILTEDELVTLDAVSAPKAEYPGWMLARQSEGRVPGAKRSALGARRARQRRLVEQAWHDIGDRDGDEQGERAHRADRGDENRDADRRRWRRGSAPGAPAPPS